MSLMLNIQEIMTKRRSFLESNSTCTHAIKHRLVVVSRLR